MWSYMTICGQTPIYISKNIYLNQMDTWDKSQRLACQIKQIILVIPSPAVRCFPFIIYSLISESCSFSLDPFTAVSVTFFGNAQVHKTRVNRWSLEEVPICRDKPIWSESSLGHCGATPTPTILPWPTLCFSLLPLLSQASVPPYNCVQQQPNHDRWLQSDWIKKPKPVRGGWTRDRQYAVILEKVKCHFDRRVLRQKAS